jgi:diguanylate cyclase (GGDEF)-like protein
MPRLLPSQKKKKELEKQQQAQQEAAGESMSQNLVDRVIGEHFVDDPATQFRARILISSWILFLVTLLFFGALTALLPMKPEARASGITLAVVISFLLAIMIATFQKSGNYRLYGNLSVLIGFSGMVVSVILSESPVTSPSIGLFYLIPLLAVFFLGLESGFFWVFITLVVLIVLFALERLGFEFWNFYDEAFMLETSFSAMVLGMTGVLGLVITYERANRRLRLERDAEYERLEFLANHDELTGLSNRMNFESNIEEAIERLGLSETASKLVLIYLDLDGFKPVNDEHGHKAGDHVLKIVAQRINNLISGKGFAARHGGDEFIILLEHISEKKAVENFVRSLQEAISDNIHYGKVELSIDASIGIAFFPKDAQEISLLIRNADAAMYHAKTNKSGYVFYQDMES